MKIVEWPSGVNRIVTSDTNGNVGENGVESDKSENGTEMTRLKGSGVPDKYSVTMYFSNSTSDSFYKNHTDAYGKHITEWQAWKNWFKYVTMNGTHPFHFHDLEDPREGRSKIYKIQASGLPGWNATGEYVQVHMSWTEQINEYMTVVTMVSDADYLDMVQGRIELHLTEQPEAPVLKENFYGRDGNCLVKYSVDKGLTWLPLPVERVDWDGFKCAVLYYDSAYTARRLDDSYYTVRVPYGTGYAEYEIQGE